MCARVCVCASIVPLMHHSFAREAISNIHAGVSRLNPGGLHSDRTYAGIPLSRQRTMGHAKHHVITFHSYVIPGMLWNGAIITVALISLLSHDQYSVYSVVWLQ